MVALGQASRSSSQLSHADTVDLHDKRSWHNAATVQALLRSMWAIIPLQHHPRPAMAGRAAGLDTLIAFDARQARAQAHHPITT
jgi:hypothetical protein